VQGCWIDGDNDSDRELARELVFPFIREVPIINPFRRRSKYLS